MKTFTEEIEEAAQSLRETLELDRIEPTLQAWHEEICDHTQAVSNAMIARAGGHDPRSSGRELRTCLAELAAVAVLIARQIETEDARAMESAQTAAQTEEGN